jgi:hypothetical protein
MPLTPALLEGAGWSTLLHLIEARTIAHDQHLISVI